MAHCVFCCGNMWCRLATGRTGGQNEPQRLVSAYFLLALVCHLCVKTFERKKRNGKNSVSGFIQFLPSTSMLSTQFSPGHFSKSRVKLRKISWSGPCFQKHVRFCYKKTSRKSLILSDALKEMEYLFTNFAWLLDFLFADTMKMQLLPTLWR